MMQEIERRFARCSKLIVRGSPNSIAESIRQQGIDGLHPAQDINAKFYTADSDVGVYVQRESEFSKPVSKEELARATSAHASIYTAPLKDIDNNDADLVRLLHQAGYGVVKYHRDFMLWRPQSAGQIELFKLI